MIRSQSAFSRRGILGVLIAAPVIGPVVTRAVAAHGLSSGGYLRGVAGASNIGDAATDYVLSRDSIRRLRIEVDSSQVDAFTRRLQDARRLNGMLPIDDPVTGDCVYPGIDQPISGVPLAGRAPNRLFGTTINEYGEAV